MKSQDLVVLNATILPEQKAALRQYAKDAGLTISAALRDVLECWLIDELETARAAKWDDNGEEA